MTWLEDNRHIQEGDLMVLGRSTYFTPKKEKETRKSGKERELFEFLSSMKCLKKVVENYYVNMGLMFYSSFHFLVIVSLLLLPTITIHNFLQWSTCERITGRIGEISAERERARIRIINVIRVFSLSLYVSLSHSRGRTNWQHTFFPSTAKELSLNIFGRKFSKYVNFMVSIDNKTYFFPSAFKILFPIKFKFHLSVNVLSHLNFDSLSDANYFTASVHSECILVLSHSYGMHSRPFTLVRNEIPEEFSQVVQKLWNCDLGAKKVRLSNKHSSQPRHVFSVYFDVWMSFWTAMKNSNICTQ